jgi:chitinase
MTHRRARTVLAFFLGLPLTAAMTAAAIAPQGATSSQAATAQRGDGHQQGPRYAPYFETWTKDTLPSVAQASGARDLTLAFLQTPKRGSCSVAWNGIAKDTVRPGGRYVSGIAKLHTMRLVVASETDNNSGEHGRLKIAGGDSVTKIPGRTRSVVTSYGVTRLDMDVDNSLNRGYWDRPAQCRAGAAPVTSSPGPTTGPDHLHPGCSRGGCLATAWLC